MCSHSALSPADTLQLEQLRLGLGGWGCSYQTGVRTATIDTTWEAEKQTCFGHRHVLCTLRNCHSSMHFAQQVEGVCAVVGWSCGVLGSGVQCWGALGGAVLG